MKETFQRWMSGRYGWDALDFFLLFLAAFVMGIPFVGILAVLPLGYGVFRMLSKNHPARRKELNAYNAQMFKLARFMAPFFMVVAKGVMKVVREVKNTNLRIKERKVSVFKSCPGCGNLLRLPRHRGKLLATCPVCRREFPVMTGHPEVK